MNRDFAKNENGTQACKAAYLAPAIEVIEIEIEGAILAGSGPDFGDGGFFE